MKTTRKGVSATEVLCAAVILALGLVPLLSLQTRTTRQAGLTRGHALAMLHARSVLDRLATRGAEALAREAAQGPVAIPDLPAPDGFLMGETTVEVVEEQPGVVTVEVSLTWHVSTSKTQRVRCTRLVARRDLSWTIGTSLS